SSWLVEEGMKVERKAVRTSLPPGGSVTLFESSRRGRLVGLKLGPAAAFAGKDRDILIKITWDAAAEPAVMCPVGDLFGYSFGDPAMRSLLVGTAEGMNYIYIPMPFERSARVELVSERTWGSAVPVQAEIAYAGPGKASDEGRFYARWRRENPTAVGTPFTYLRTTGRGHVLGMILQAQGLVSGQTPFFEGDDRAVIDGQLAIPGTGSEDSFNGGWYDVPGRWEGRRSYPLSGCLDYQKPLGRTGGYRWLIADSYAYAKSIDFTIEHAPEGNLLQTDYTGVTFFYSLDPPPQGEAPLPGVDARRFSDPERIVYVPGWTVPIHSFSLQNAVFEKKAEKIGDGWARFLSMRTKGEDVFGPHHISFICGVPAAGRYKVGIKAVTGPDQGIVQVYRNDLPAGEAVNLYAAARAVSAVLPLGVFEMAAGDNLLFLELVGKDARSKGTGIGMDLVEIIFERVK
ncbi:MAG: glycoside hydrolase family 172 protein, partial [Candidatus Aminicenantales bacterium]